ncbi:MAG: hypothetical protein K0U78_21530 [Actinomycetia bacterium]|nr:hypothetical protein [Actinomycetes bacterium]
MEGLWFGLGVGLTDPGYVLFRISKSSPIEIIDHVAFARRDQLFAETDAVKHALGEATHFLLAEGPGGFTAVRMGFAFLHGLRGVFRGGLRYWGVDNFQIVARAAGFSTAGLDARSLQQSVESPSAGQQITGRLIVSTPSLRTDYFLACYCLPVANSPNADCPLPLLWAQNMTKQQLSETAAQFASDGTDGPDGTVTIIGDRAEELAQIVEAATGIVVQSTTKTASARDLSLCTAVCRAIPDSAQPVYLRPPDIQKPVSAA